jgi:hypothetical protein
MRTKIILGLATMLAVATGLVYHVTRSDARWHILSGTAINTNKLCSDGLKYTWASGETDTQPPATRPVGTPGWAGPVDLLVQHAPTTTPATEDDWFNTPDGRCRRVPGRLPPGPQQQHRSGRLVSI